VFDPPAAQAPAPNAAANAAAPNAPVELGSNFAFQPGMGAQTIGHFDPLHDTIELDHFANAQTVGQLTSLIIADSQRNAVIALGHDNSVTVAGMTPQQLQAVLSNVVHLH
jgi:hypothetical protein